MNSMKRDHLHRQYDNQSPYIAKIEDRSKVNVALWGSSGGKKPKCDICKQTLVTPAGQTYLQCPSCGKRITAEEIKDRQTKTLSATSTKAGPMIVSQPKRKRRGSSLDGELDEETEEDLITLGFGPTASFKDYLPD
jgi:DNA-directed RNA polymerase subunit RPC12/RpoP